MDLPTLSHDEYDALAKDAGEWGALATEFEFLTAFDGSVEELVSGAQKTEALRVIYLGARTPMLYRTREGKAVVVLPPAEAVTYDMIETFYPHEEGEEPWLYKITPYIGAPWELDKWMFRDGADFEDGGRSIPAYNAAELVTH